VIASNLLQNGDRVPSVETLATSQLHQRILMTGSLSHLAQSLQDLAIAREVTVATAESCTGGNIAHQITLIPGSSDYFLGGIVSYANDVKHNILGVSLDILENPGAVSEPCARAMAEGARTALGASLAVATTGIAGPGGGTDRKPVGLVYIALADPSETLVEEHIFSGTREGIIDAATRRALQLLHNAVALEIA
jgi:PncC family amidohydrolase